MQLDVIASRNPNAIHDMLLQKIKTGQRSHLSTGQLSDWDCHHTVHSISDTTASSGGATSGVQ